MAAKIFNILFVIFLTIALTPLIAVYCLLWAFMTVGGGFVKRIFKKNIQ